MALDIGIFHKNKSPIIQTSLGLEAHQQLVNHLSYHNTFLLLRMNDYYKDACFKVGELSNILSEINTLKKESREESLLNFLNTFEKIIKKAKNEKISVDTIAD